MDENPFYMSVAELQIDSETDKEGEEVGSCLYMEGASEDNGEVNDAENELLSDFDEESVSSLTHHVQPFQTPGIFRA